MPYIVQLDTVFENADTVKSGGAKWDKVAKKWVVKDPISFERCIDFVPDGTVSPWPERDWKEFSYEHRAQAKQQGCWWDAECKCWFTPNAEDRARYRAMQSPTNSD